MSAILTIAKRDLKSFFTSPKGLTIFFIFLFLMGWFFKGFVGDYLYYQQQAGMMGGGQAPTLEMLLRAFFLNLYFIFVLVIPAVTMATFSEEKKNQTLRLLMAAPVTPTQIVLGKFLAAAALMAAVLLASIVFPGYLMAFGTPDRAMIFGSYLGVFLLVCAQLSFGIWVSAMTNNQFIAFIFTMAGLFLLMILDWVATKSTSTGLVQSTLKYLATTDHLQTFLKGMISTSSVVYFLCFICTFLFFTNVAIDSQRWR